MSEAFSSLTGVDKQLLLGVLSTAMRKTDDGHASLSVLELGVFYGSTARGIKEWCDGRNVNLTYLGVDDGSHPNFQHSRPADWPYPNSVKRGATWDVHREIPDGWDLVIVDANHSGNAVILDTVIYQAKVRPGGWMLFHDTAPHIQQTMKEQNAPSDLWWSNSVNEALKLLRWPWDGWVIVSDDYDPTATFGGFRSYFKVP